RLLQAEPLREVPAAARPVQPGDQAGRRGRRQGLGGAGRGPEVAGPDRRDRQDLLGDQEGLARRRHLTRGFARTKIGLNKMERAAPGPSASSPARRVASNGPGSSSSFVLVRSPVAVHPDRNSRSVAGVTGEVMPCLGSFAYAHPRMPASRMDKGFVDAVRQVAAKDPGRTGWRSGEWGLSAGRSANW